MFRMPSPRSRCLLLAALAAAAPVFPKGILVRFLAAGPGDSAVRYDVYRYSAGDSARRIGSAAAGSDTVAFPDSGALRGVAYGYAMRAVDGAGRQSGLSDTTLAAIPLLALPDTLRADSWPVAWTLPASAHPLRGTASLALELVPAPSSVPPAPAAPGAEAAPMAVTLAYDTGSGRIEFRASPARPGTLRIALRAAYFGKFIDVDTAVIAVAGMPVTLAPSRDAAATGASPAGAGFTAFGRARHADGRRLPVLVARRGGSRLGYDAAGRRAGTMATPADR